MNLNLPVSHDLALHTEREIQNYFYGRDVQINDIDGIKNITLRWPEYPDYYIDPDIMKGMAWWDEGFQVADIPYACKKRNGYQLSMNDNWTLHAWCKWADANPGKHDSKAQKIIILHLDDHTDCMSPHVIKHPGGDFTNLFTGEIIRPENPQSVINSIISGSVSIGSFVTMFLHLYPNAEFRHLMPAHRMANYGRYGGADLSFQEDNMLASGSLRPAISFSKPGVPSQIRYLPTDNLDLFLSEIPPDSDVLVHIDMDYFNNKFDGDSDWTHKSFIHNPSDDSVLTRITDVFSALRAKTDRKQIADFTIALSPGFFPVSLWEPCIRLIDEQFNF